MEKVSDKTCFTRYIWYRLFAVCVFHMDDALISKDICVSFAQVGDSLYFSCYVGLDQASTVQYPQKYQEYQELVLRRRASGAVKRDLESID